jgi:hypothetical protein
MVVPCSYQQSATAWVRMFLKRSFRIFARVISLASILVATFSYDFLNIFFEIIRTPISLFSFKINSEGFTQFAGKEGEFESS